MRANESQIHDAYDDKLFGGADEHQLSAARSRLTVARDRLREEIRFLPDLSPATAKDTVLAVSKCGDLDELIRLSAKLPNLARINLIADVLSSFPSPAAIAEALKAHASFDPDSALRTINDCRSASGFKQVNADAWKKEIAIFQEDQADAIQNAMSANENGPDLLIEAVQGRNENKPSEWYRRLLDQVVERYDRWSQPELSRIEESFDRSINRLEADPTDISILDAITSDLQRWDRLSQPVQLREQAKGLDEPKSRRIFGKIRELALKLANEHSAYEPARRLTVALQGTFSELPKASAQLAEDLKTLNDLIEQESANRVLAPLFNAAEQARANLGRLSSETSSSQFSASGYGLAGALFREFVSASAQAGDLADEDFPWTVVRSVAIDLGNDLADFEGAARILKAILPSAPPSLRPKLEADLATLKQMNTQKRFKDACEAKDLELASSLAAQLIDLDPEHRAQYTTIKENLDSQIARRSRSRWFWGILALIVVVSYFVSQSSTPRPPSYDDSSSSYDPSTPTFDGSGYGSSTYDDTTADAEADNAVDNALDAAGNSIDPAPTAEIETGNATPPLNFFGTLSKPQLRYCKFEKRRLEILNGRLQRYGANQFNSRVRDFNSRCGQASFGVLEGVEVDAEVQSHESQLQLEAAALIDDWRPKYEFPAPETPPAGTQEELPSSANPFEAGSDGDEGYEDNSL